MKLVEGDTRDELLIPNGESYKRQILAASSQLLRGTVTGLVVCGFADATERAQLRNEPEATETGVYGEIDTSLLYELFPVLSEIDQLVNDWSENEETYGYTCIKGISFALIRRGGIPPHVDGPYPTPDGNHTLYGPLIGSLRLDENEFVQRKFSLRAWPGKTPCLADGTPTEQYVRNEPNRNRLLARYFNKRAGTQVITQNPGDLVLMRGNPSPAQHAVLQYGTTQQAVFGYQMQGVGDANSKLREIRNSEYDRLPVVRWGTAVWPT